MPATNPFAPTLELGGEAHAGAAGTTATAAGKFSLGQMGGVGSDNHWAAALVLGALVLLWALYKSKFRFSMTVG